MISKIAQKIKSNDLIRGGFVLFMGSMVANVLAYIYNLIVGRMLGPENYGVFSSLVAIVYIISVFSSTLSLLIAKFSAEYKSKNDLDSIYSIFRYTTRKFLVIGVFLFILFIAVAPFISSFLKIDSVVPTIILSSSLIVAFLVSINRGILQGILKFFSLSLNVNLEMGLRIIISALFIYLGFSVNGALLGLTLGIFVSYAVSFIPLKKIFKASREITINTSLIKHYAFPLFVSFLGMTLLYTVDVILVKHYLNDYDAGIYSALTTFGKIIFFSSSSIAMALFPMAAKKNARGEAHTHLLRDSMTIVFLISFAILGLYLFIPKIVVNLFLGNEFIESARYLVSFGVVMLFYSLINILIYYYLSINKTAVAYLPFVFSLALIVLMIFFHSSIEQIIYIRIFHIVILFVSISIFNLVFNKTKNVPDKNPS